MTERELADWLYDQFSDGPRWRREYGDAPHWRWTLDRIKGDRDGSDEMHREPWLRLARAVQPILKADWSAE